MMEKTNFKSFYGGLETMRDYREISSGEVAYLIIIFELTLKSLPKGLTF